MSHSSPVSSRSPRIIGTRRSSLAMAIACASLPITVSTKSSSQRRPGRRELACGSPISSTPCASMRSSVFGDDDTGVLMGVLVVFVGDGVEAVTQAGRADAVVGVAPGGQGLLRRGQLHGEFERLCLPG